VGIAYAFQIAREDDMASKSKNGTNKSAEPLDAVALLKADHRLVEELFEKFDKATRKDRKRKLAEQICLELTIHAMIEEEIFYPACKAAVAEDLLHESYVEHDGAKLLIAEISQGSPDDRFYDAKVKVLAEEIKHHVKEEEKRVEGMFAQAKAAGLDMQTLGELMAMRKEELNMSLTLGDLPPPETRTLQGAALNYGAPVGSL
jgi:hemerythrin superfamily protein